MHKETMKPQLSIYLDLCRFIAAVVVVLAHLIHFDIATGDWIKWLPESGRDAVILFFLLSGYVISYTCKQKNDKLKSYVIARATRVYSVALPVLILTVIVDLIGIQFNPESYNGLYQYQKLYIYIPLHLGFLGEIWTLSEQPFTVVPYWSLGYEVWYYVLFAALYFYSGFKRVFLFSLIFIFVGYKLWLLFPLWLAGVWLYRNHTRWDINQTVACLIFYGSLFGYFLYKVTGADKYLISLGEDIWPFASLPLGSAKKYLSDYAVCFFVICHLYAARYVNLSWLLKARKTIVTLASYTFTLYLVHAPLMLTIEHNSQLDTDSIYTSILVLVLVGIATWGLGFVTEKRKYKFKPPIAWLCNTFISGIKVLPLINRIVIPNSPREYKG
jgi:peptidoglycan/LPS O-acetylase OafA/YrhL